jgi:hypothetical protein
MRSMRRTQAFALLPLLVFLGLPCAAQIMDPSEYKGFLKRLDASAGQWQEQIEKLNVEQLNISFSTGKRIEESKEVGLRNLADIHAVIAKHGDIDFLGEDFDLLESLEDVSEMLGVILSEIPANEQSVQWLRPLPSLEKEIASYRRPLRNHISKYANQLQLKELQLELKAAKCSR